MHVIEAHEPMPAGLGGASVHTPAAPSRDAPELFDVDVNQLTRCGTFVACARGRPAAYQDARQRIEHRQMGHSMTGKDAPDGCRTHPELGGDPLRPRAISAP